MVNKNVQAIQDWLIRNEDKNINNEYSITEKFENDFLEYTVHNLYIEYEDGFVMFGDEKDVILSKPRSVLKAFVEDSIEDIIFYENSCKICFRTCCILISLLT